MRHHHHRRASSSRASATILASGNLDEWRTARLLTASATIDGFGVGNALDTSSDAPAIDAAAGLAAARARCAEQLVSLPDALRALEPAAPPYEVDFSAGLQALAREIDARDA